MMDLLTARRVNSLRHLGAFCRSLLPADWGQLALLAGSYLIYTCGYWPWWPVVPAEYPHELWTGLSRPPLVASSAHLFVYVAMLCAWFWLPGGAGFFLFFWGARRGARALVLWVILPACLGIAGAVSAALAIFNVNQGGLESSVLHTKRLWPVLAALARNAGTGTHVAIAGIALVGVAAWRVSRGRTLLPARFRAGAESVRDAGENELRRFAWLMLALVPPLAGVAVLCGSPLVEWILSLGNGRVPAHWLAEAAEGSRRVLAAIPLALVAIWLMGMDRAKEVARALSPRRWKMLALALALPLLVHWIPKIVFLLAARIHWATFDSRLAVPSPDIGDFLMPGRWQWDLLRFAAAALLTELAWRGYALPRFVERLGLHRGIVLLGMLWATLFQRGGWGAGGTDAGVVIALAGSLLWGVALSYSLSWLALRAGSALPAAVAMAVNWMLSQMRGNEPAPVQGWLASPYVELVLWAAAGVVLFRFFGDAAWQQRTSEPPETT